MSSTDIKSTVKQKYGEAALRATSGGSSCCGATANCGCVDPITSNLYDREQAGQVPEEALKASLGCGNPTALAKLNLGRAVELTFYSQRNEWGRPEKPTGWT